jgi:hypothetical protein
LRKLAATYVRHKFGDNTLQPTALVPEAYLRLADQKDIAMKHRAQFFGLAAKVMRDILVDHSRKGSQQNAAAAIAFILTETDRFSRTREVDFVAVDDEADTHPRATEITERTDRPLPSGEESYEQAHFTFPACPLHWPDQSRADKG